MLVKVAFKSYVIINVYIQEILGTYFCILCLFANNGNDDGDTEDNHDPEPKPKIKKVIFRSYIEIVCKS